MQWRKFMAFRGKLNFVLIILIEMHRVFYIYCCLMVKKFSFYLGQKNAEKHEIIYIFYWCKVNTLFCIITWIFQFLDSHPMIMCIFILYKNLYLLVTCCNCATATACSKGVVWTKKKYPCLELWYNDRCMNSDYSYMWILRFSRKKLKLKKI